MRLARAGAAHVPAHARPPRSVSTPPDRRPGDQTGKRSRQWTPLLVIALIYLVAVGVNCLPPSLVATSVEYLAPRTDLPILAYANSGEAWRQGRWQGGAALTTAQSWYRAARLWWDLGARGLGGCCRTTPDEIAVLARAVRELRAQI